MLSAVYSVFREEAKLCVFGKTWSESSVFAENAELNGAFLVITQ